MSYPNSALSAWQLAMIAGVVIAALAVWLLLVYSAAREPRERHAQQPGAGTSPAPIAHSDAHSEEPAKPEREAVG